MADQTSKQPDPARLHEQTKAFLAVRPDYQAYAKFLKSVLERACLRIDPRAWVQSRAKTAPSFAEKCVRRGYADPLEEMWDLCGARVVVNSTRAVAPVEQVIKRSFSTSHHDDKADVLAVDGFGYLSIHLIVQIPNTFVPPFPLTDDERAWLTAFQAARTPKGHPVRAEVQVRTLLQHAWADACHDRTYKTKLRLPRDYRREVARLAAVLEEADSAMAQATRAIDAYQVDFGAYMNEARSGGVFGHHLTPMTARLTEHSFSDTKGPDRDRHLNHLARPFGRNQGGAPPRAPQGASAPRP